MSADVGAEDLAPWRDPDALLDALDRLGERVDAGKRPNDSVRDALRVLLEHEDADVRQEALRLLLIALKESTARSLGIEMLRSDENDEVRGAAAYGIAAVSSAATRLEDTALLLEILLDEDESNETRGSAYEALLIIHRHPRFPPLNRTFDPATDIDRAWIEGLRRGTTGTAAGG